jgi:preprotein translocase subunit SecD
LTAVGLILVALYVTMIATGHTTPELGLDLRGGTSVILTPVNKTGVTTGALNQAVSIIDERVNGLGVSGASVNRQGNNIVVSVPGKGRNSVLGLVGQTAALDFRQICTDAAPVAAVTTTSPTPTPTPSVSGSASPATKGSRSPTASPRAKAAATHSAKAKDSARISRTGAGAAGGTTLAAYVVARHAGAKATHSASPAATHTPSASASASASATPSASPSASSSAATTPTIQCVSVGGVTPKPPASVVAKYDSLTCTKGSVRPTNYIDQPTQWQAACLDPSVTSSSESETRFLLLPAALTGKSLSGASAEIQQSSTGVVTGGWEVVMNFKSSVQNTVYDLTKRLQGNTQTGLAIVLDGVVESAPYIESAFSSSASITGNFSQTQADDLANVLKYGALPLSFTDSQAESISASLGHSSLNAGLLAGAIGLALVIIYCFIYYRALGFLTVASLSVSGLLVYALVTLAGPAIGETLDLAGIAGLIVAVGITADSFVVFYERLKDEVREGRTVRSSVDRGWKRAIRTILAADTISLLAALILYAVSVGDVRGFAFTLGLSTLLDLFVVFLFTRPIVTLAIRMPFFSTSRWSGLSPGHAGIPRASRPQAGGPSARES